MNPHFELPNLGSNFQQAHADRPERPGCQIDGIPSIGALRLVNDLDRSQIVSTVEEIIETGGQPAWRHARSWHGDGIGPDFREIHGESINVTGEKPA